MDEGSKIVIDASVILAWILPDERSQLADEVLNKVKDGILQLCAPRLLIYEVGNSLRSAVLQDRIKVIDVKQVVELFRSVVIEFFDLAEEDMEEVAEMAIKLQVSFYDATYVKLSRDMRVKFITLDGKLAKKV